MSSSVFPNSVGYDLDLFDDPKDKKFLEDNFLCTICLMVCRDAVQTNNLRVPVKNKSNTFESCGHVFCEECIKKYLSSQKQQCATCRTTLYSCELQPCHVARRLIAQAKIKCIHHEQGCQWTGEIGKDSNNILSHLSNSCDFFPRPCPFNMAHANLPKAEMNEHEKVCPHRPIQCEHCNRSLTFLQYEDHLFLSCPVFTPVPCPFNIRHPKLPPKEMDLHKSQCADRDVPCPKCDIIVSLNEMSRHIIEECQMTLVRCPNECFDHYSNQINESNILFKVSADVRLDSTTLNYLREQSKKHSKVVVKNRWAEGHQLANQLLQNKHLGFSSTAKPQPEKKAQNVGINGELDAVKGIALLNPFSDQANICKQYYAECLVLELSSFAYICSIYMPDSVMTLKHIISDQALILPRTMPRNYLLAHSQTCPLQKIDCPYKKFGCTFPAYWRYLMDLHLADDFKIHSKLIDKKLTQSSLSLLQSLYSNSLSGPTDSKDSSHSLHQSEPYLMKFPGFGNVRPVSFFDDKLWRKKLEVGDLVDYQDEKDVWYLSAVHHVVHNQDAWSIECKGKKPVGYVTRSSVTIQPPWTRSGGRVGSFIFFPGIKTILLESSRLVPPPKDYQSEFFIPTLPLDEFTSSISSYSPSCFLTSDLQIEDLNLGVESYSDFLRNF